MQQVRSVLTLLGVVIGVAAVIAVVTFVSGINGYVSERIFRLGADVFMVFKVSPVVTNVDQFLEGEKRKDITLEEYRALAENCRRCKYVGAAQSNSTGKVSYSDVSSTDTTIRGWTPSFVPIYDLEIVHGRAFTESDQDNTAPVAIIGQDIVDNLLAGLDPIGKEIRVDGQPYQVIGLGKREGKTLGLSRDNYVILPLSAWMKQYGARKSITISAKAEGGISNLDAAMDEARAIVRARRHDLPGKPDSFALETNQSFMGIWTSISGSFFIADDRHRVGGASGGRHRDHEYYAGVGDRAHPRNRHSQGAGRAPAGRAAAVPDRIQHLGNSGRDHWDCARDRGRQDGDGVDRYALQHKVVGGCGQPAGFGQRRDLLWRVSGPAGGGFGPDYRATV